ncbi:RNA polymerase sigma-70 factor [Saccharicrinis carchari]|uniref:RNA polymerase sigma-70 factor n=1 Tax=Saccharicrinis carchari TaxID=1168039 RepID=UPI00163D4E54|nr:RNA polymerase sigma-70 factor [Saccharicrinis carchari]
MKTNVEQAIVGLKAGNPISFNLLFTEYYRRLHFFALQYVQHSDVSDNLVQDTYLALWKNRKNIKANHEAALLSWLYTVLKNNCCHYLKQKKARHEFSAKLLQEQGELDIAGLEQLDTSEQVLHEINAIVEDTLEKLSPQCRRVFEMSRFDGLKNKEIAAELSITTKAVERNMTRALKVFRISLREYLPAALLFWVG